MKFLRTLLTWTLERSGFSSRFIHLFIKELRLLIVRLYSVFSLKQRNSIKHARRKSGLKVSLACGYYIHDGWIGIDSSFQSKADWYLDLRKKLPLADGSCSFLFCEHFLEHLVYPEETESFLAECYRILEAGGVLRIIVPDAGKFAKAYADNDVAFLQDFKPDSNVPLEAFNSIVYGVPLGEHHYAYDLEMLSQLPVLAPER